MRRERNPSVASSVMQVRIFGKGAFPGAVAADGARDLAALGLEGGVASVT
jgi:hypothetical protein